MPGNAEFVLITGAGSGLGRGLSTCLAQRGLHVVCTDLNGEAAAETARQIQAAGGKASGVALDVTSEGNIRRVLESLPGGRVDVLINNAGLQFVSPLEEFPVEKWKLLLDILLTGSFLLTRAVLPGMKQRQFGRIINIGSIHSQVASPFKSAYVAAKHGLLGLSKVIALETGDFDITINTLCPSYIRTPLVDAQIKNQALSNKISEAEVIEKIMLQPMPKKAFITVEEVAGAAEFLISNAARNITGQTIVMDGGWTAR